MIKLAVVARDEEYLQRLEKSLRREEDIRMINRIIFKNIKNEVQQAISFVKQMITDRPDVLLLDQTVLRDAAAINVKQVLIWRDKLKSMKVIITSERFNEENVMTILQAGARGFFLYAQGEKQLTKCIALVAEGEIWLDRVLATRFLEEFIEENKKNKERLNYLAALNTAKLDILSSREMEVLALISQGMTNEEIADKLCLSPKTIKTHLRNIFEKSEIRNRVEAALVYTRHAIMSQ